MVLRKHQKQPENQIGILFYVPYLSAARLRVKTAEFGAEKLPSLFTALYGIWAFPKWSYGRRSSSRASRLMALRKHQKQPENPIGILFYVPYLSAARLRVKTAEFGPEKLAILFTALYGFWAFPKWYCGRRSSSRFKSYEVSKFRLALGRKIKIKRGSTRGLPGRSPVLVLLSPKHT
ncbi:hypothetical protein YC2023_051342 [Brassica napus]